MENNRYCRKCGIQLKDSDRVCPMCGTPVAAPAAQDPSTAAYTDPVTGRYTPPGQVYYTPTDNAGAYSAPVQTGAEQTDYDPSPAASQNGYAAEAPKTDKAATKKGIIIAAIAAGAVTLIAVLAIALSGGSDAGASGGQTAAGGGSGGSGSGGIGLFSRALTDKDLPDVTYSYLTDEKKIEVDFVAADTVYPNLYSTMDSIVNLTATCEGGEAQAMIKVEIPGFTQPYEQKVMLSEQITKLYIKPALLTGELDLSSSKDAQINITVSDIDTGKIYTQETRQVKLMSVYDFCLSDDEFGEYNRYDLLAWLTPESDGILKLRRSAISWLESYTDGLMNSLPGYQMTYFNGDDYYLNVIYQVLGIQAAMSGGGLRYNMGSFSMTEGANQRILLPDDSLASGSGVCIETALIMASAIQSANMHAMIILPPGHAQVAIEDWNNSGDYWLLETTALPFSGSTSDINSFLAYLDADEWRAYLADPWGDGSGACFVLDCDMAAPLGIIGFNN